MARLVLALLALTAVNASHCAGGGLQDYCCMVACDSSYGTHPNDPSCGGAAASVTRMSDVYRIASSQGCAPLSPGSCSFGSPQENTCTAKLGFNPTLPQYIGATANTIGAALGNPTPAPPPAATFTPTDSPTVSPTAYPTFTDAHIASKSADAKGNALSGHALYMAGSHTAALPKYVEAHDDFKSVLGAGHLLAQGMLHRASIVSVKSGAAQLPGLDNSYPSGSGLNVHQGGVGECGASHITSFTNGVIESGAAAPTAPYAKFCPNGGNSKHEFFFQLFGHGFPAVSGPMPADSSRSACEAYCNTEADCIGYFYGPLANGMPLCRAHWNSNANCNTACLNNNPLNTECSASCNGFPSVHTGIKAYNCAESTFGPCSLASCESTLTAFNVQHQFQDYVKPAAPISSFGGVEHKRNLATSNVTCNPGFIGTPSIQCAPIPSGGATRGTSEGESGYQWVSVGSCEFDPWYNTGWASTATGTSSGTVATTQSASVTGHLVIVHNTAGAKVGCGPLILNTAGENVAAITTIPGYTGSLTVGGTFTFVQAGSQLDGVYTLTGLPALTTGSFHVHAGTSCAAVGGHFATASTENPTPGHVHYPTLGYGVKVGMTAPPASLVYDSNDGAATKLGGLGLASPNGEARFNVQSDGNMVVSQVHATNSGVGNILWPSGTAGNPGAYLQLQQDGNLVLYDTNGGVLWKTDTTNGVRLEMQDDLNLVLYDSNGVASWSSGTALTTAPSYEEFCVGRAGPAPGWNHGALDIMAIPAYGFGTPLKANWGTGSLITPENIGQKCQDWCSSDNRCIGYWVNNMHCQPDFKSSADCSAVCEENPTGFQHGGPTHSGVNHAVYCNEACVLRWDGPQNTGYTETPTGTFAADKPCWMSTGWVHASGYLPGNTFKKI